MKKDSKIKRILAVAAAFSCALSVFCGGCDTGDIFGKHAHSYVNYVSDDNATCTANGTETAKCEKCDKTHTREEKNSKREHSFVSYAPNGDATCTANGTETAKCEYCDATDKREISNSKTEHLFTNYIPDGNATEERDGTKTAKCDRCDQTDTVADEGTKLPPAAEPAGGVPVKGSAEEINEADFSIHFLELGNKYTGDCTLIKCGDTEILIDAGSRQNSAPTLNKYIARYCTDGVLEYVIATHAHQDHISGFIGNSSGGKYNGVFYQYKIGTLIQFAGTNQDPDKADSVYQKYCDSVKYIKGEGTTVYTAKQCWYETDGAQRQYFLDKEKTLSISVLYNYYYDNSTSDENDYSVCVLLTKSLGDKSYSYLFTGDLEESGESYLVNNNALPEVELFKGGHHGSYTATTTKLLNVIKPKCVAVCCCSGSPEYTQNVNNTFPSQEFINRVSRYTDKIYVTSLAIDVPAVVDGKISGKTWNYTSMNGDIVFYYGDKWKLYCSNNYTLLKDTEWFKANRKWQSAGA